MEEVIKSIENKEIENNIVKVKSIYKLEKLYVGDSGYILKTILERKYIEPFQTTECKTCVYVELPKGYEIQIRPHIDTLKRGILVHPIVIHEGYRGEIELIVTNISKDRVLIKHDTNLALMMFVKKTDDLKIEYVKTIETHTHRNKNNN